VYELSEKDVNRFDAKVQRSHVPGACWPWLAARDQDGYGLFKLHSKMVKAHRVAFQLTNGPVPPGLLVLHRCDTPSCCNAAHLFAGTHQDNMDDMALKGRGGIARRAHHGRARLTEADVTYIRVRFASGRASQSDIAREKGVSQALISKIVNHQLW
jgi:hypothetical protein